MTKYFIKINWPHTIKNVLITIKNVYILKKHPDNFGASFASKGTLLHLRNSSAHYKLSHAGVYERPTQPPRSTRKYLTAPR